MLCCINVRITFITINYSLIKIILHHGLVTQGLAACVVTVHEFATQVADYRVCKNILYLLLPLDSLPSQQLVFTEYKACSEWSIRRLEQFSECLLKWHIQYWNVLRLQAMDNWKSVEARSYSSVIIILLEGRIFRVWVLKRLCKGVSNSTVIYWLFF